MKEEEKIHKLIEYELINSKLITQLNSIGLDANLYLTDLSELVFDLMGLEDNEELHEYYNELIIDTSKIGIEDIKKSINKYSQSIYNELNKFKKQ